MEELEYYAIIDKMIKERLGFSEANEVYIKGLPDKYRDINEIINHILPDKYKDLRCKIYFVNSKWELLRYYHWFSWGTFKDFFKGENFGSYFYTQGKMLIYTFAIEDWSKRNCKDEDREKYCKLHIINSILHEIKHRYQHFYNPTMTAKSQKYNAKDLKKYYDCPLEKQAENFSVAIMKKNQDYIDKFVGSDWNIKYV